MAKVNKVFIYIIAYSAGSCNAPYSEYGNQCVQFAADAGTQSHYNSKLHCRVNGGEIAKLGTADEYKTGTLNVTIFMYLLINMNITYQPIFSLRHISFLFRLP